MRAMRSACEPSFSWKTIKFEFRQPVFQPRLQVGVVEELGVGKPRADDALVAGDDRTSAVGRLLVRHQYELVDQLGVLRIAQHEAFLVVADGGADHFAGDGQETLVERAHQRDRPFHQAGDFGQQPVVLHHLVALREGKMLGVGADHVGAAFGIEHHLGGFELGDIVVEAAHLEGGRRHEAVAARLVAGGKPVNLEADDVGLLGLRTEGREDRMQRPHPTEPSAAPAHRFRPRERAHHLGNHLADDLERRPPGLLDHRHIEVALLVGLHFGVGDRRQARRFHKAGDGVVGRADARAFLFLFDVGLLGRHAVHGERQAARRGESLSALVDQARRHQAVGHHLAQVVGGARLHARGDLLRQEFKQQIGHRRLINPAKREFRRYQGKEKLSPAAFMRGGSGFSYDFPYHSKRLGKVLHNKPRNN